MTRTIARLSAAALAVGALTVGITGNASAAPADSDPPIISFQPGMTFFAGSALSASDQTATIPARVSWTQYDPDGICGRYAYLYRANNSTISPNISPSATSYTGAFSAAGGNELDIYSSDCAGNDGVDYTTPQATLTQSGSFNLSAGWSTSSCACWSGGGIVKSSKVGATASYQFYGYSAALVGVIGTGRGSAKIYLDGKLQTTVNELQSDPNKGVNRAVIYATKALPYRSHTIKVVTTTKARVDLDALVVSN